MPAPFLANIINAAILFGIVIVAGKKPVIEGLKKRKERIVQGMEEAGKMKAEAEKQLGEYEERLKHLDSEIARIKKDMRESAEAERHRILAEAKDRRERMERDAKLLVDQEMKAAREALMHETVAAAMKSAEEIIAKELVGADHDRLAGDYLATLQKAPLGNEARGR
jgi:F-type H+-transporting ATPase subunit b